MGCTTTTVSLSTFTKPFQSASFSAAAEATSTTTTPTPTTYKSWEKVPLQKPSYNLMKNFNEMQSKTLEELAEVPKPPKNSLTGIVTSDKMNKTCVVAVTRHKMIHKYNVRRNYTNKFKAHDEHDECEIGDTVRISPTRPLSKSKFFAVSEILKKVKKI